MESGTGERRKGEVAGHMVRRILVEILITGCGAALAVGILCTLVAVIVWRAGWLNLP